MKTSDLEPHSVKQINSGYRNLGAIVIAICCLASCYGTESGLPGTVTCTLPAESKTDWAVRFTGFELDCTQIYSFEDVNNASAVIEIEFTEVAQLDSLNFSNFDNLELLVINNTNVSGVFLPTNNQLNYLKLDTPNLVELELPGNRFRQVVFNNLESLKSVKADHITVDTLRISGEVHFDASDLFSNNQLRVLATDYSNFETYRTNELLNVTDLSLTGVTTESLDFSFAPALQQLTVLDSDLETLQLVSPGATKILVFMNSSFGTLDLTESPSLMELDIFGTDVANIDISNLVELRSLNISQGSGIPSIDLTNNFNLTDILISGTDLRELDLSATSIEYVDLNNTNITSIALPTSYDEYAFGVMNMIGHKSESLAFEGGAHFSNFSFEWNDGITQSIDISSLQKLKLFSLNQVDLDVLDMRNLNSLNFIHINDSAIDEIMLPGFFYQNSHTLDNGDFVCKPHRSWPPSFVDELDEYADNIFCLTKSSD